MMRILQWIVKMLGVSIAGLSIFNSGCKNENSENKRERILSTDSIRSEIPYETDYFTDSNELSSFYILHPQFLEDSNQVNLFYRSRLYRFAWINKNGIIEQAAHFINLINNSKNSSSYNDVLVSKLSDLLDSTKSRMVQGEDDSGIFRETELTFTASYFAFAKKEYEGLNDSLFGNLEWYIPRKKINFNVFLDSLLIRPANWIAANEPVFFMYQKLRNALDVYTLLACTHDWSAFPIPVKELVPGGKDSSIIGIKKRLQLLGDFETGDTNLEFSNDLFKAIKRFQMRFGLEPDGRMNALFYEALNIPLEKRIREILINMERCRWLPVRPAGPYILINLPEYKLKVFDGEHFLWGCNVIVGKASTNTVIFTDSLQYIVFSPYWNVPNAIIENEIIPEMVGNSDYIRKHDMEIITYDSPFRNIDPDEIKWGTIEAHPFPYMIRQRPSAKNALGRVKFLFPNNFSIYLHDTPEKSLFSQSSRSFSHGCIRIEEPLKLAMDLLQNDSAWNEKKITKAMFSGKEKFVRLHKKVPVFILYLTAWVDDSGTVNFRKDIYGHDEKMENVMFEAEDVYPVEKQIN